MSFLFYFELTMCGKYNSKHSFSLGWRFWIKVKQILLCWPQAFRALWYKLKMVSSHATHISNIFVHKDTRIITCTSKALVQTMKIKRGEWTSPWIRRAERTEWKKKWCKQPMGWDKINGVLCPLDPPKHSVVQVREWQQTHREEFFFTDIPFLS